jgi:tripartite-type tricarboxylate transporter receptor subunit TctC
LPFVLNGSLKPIAFGDDRRLPQLPDVPTFKESGVNFTMGTWFGLLAPAQTPAPIIATLHKAITGSSRQSRIPEDICQPRRSNCRIIAGGVRSLPEGWE